MLPAAKYADVDQAYREAFARGMRPEPRTSVAQWSEDHRRLSRVASSEPGRWRNARTPYLVEIMEVLSVTSPVTDVWFMKATQVGATECGNNWVGSVIHKNPAPMMVVFPTSATAKRQSKQRIAPMLEETPALINAVKKPRARDSGNTTLLKEFVGGILILAGANSAKELRSSPVKNLFLDEIDEYPADLDNQGDPLLLAEKRTSNFARRKRFKVSTPTVKGHSRIERGFNRSDQRYYFVPCPHCAHEQKLVWDQMRWSTRKVLEHHCRGCGEVHVAGVLPGALSCTCDSCGLVADLEQHPLNERDTGELDAVHYECESCHEPIAEHHKTAMLAGGRWIATAPGPNKDVGFHLNALYSPLGWYSWTEAVTDRLEAEGNPADLKVWTNTVLGLTYSVDADQPDTDLLAGRLSDYRIGQVPAGALFLTAAVDVQKDRLEIKVKGWGRGEESWLIDWQQIYGNPNQPEVWNALDDLRAKRYPHAFGADLPIEMTAIDSGGHHTHEVYNYVRRRRRVMAVKGASTRGKAVLSRPSLVDVKASGKVHKRGVKLWLIGTDTAKKTIYGRLKIIDAGRPGYMHFPHGLPVDYFDQLTAEKIITRYVRGFEVHDFDKEPNARNEALDCEVYAYAAALHAGLARKRWPALEARLRARAERQAASVSQETPPAAPASSAPAAPIDPLLEDQAPPPKKRRRKRQRTRRHRGLATIDLNL